VVLKSKYPNMIKPLRYDDGQLTTIVDGVGESTTITKFDLLVWSSGYLTRATQGVEAGEIHFMAMEDVATGGGETSDILVLNLNGVECEADTAAEIVIATDRGVWVDITDHETINESSSTKQLFLITEMVGETTDKKVRGYFNTLTAY
jgi:hypothetical protein